MKDALGHGSNARLSSAQGPASTVPKAGGAKGNNHVTQIHGGAPVASNAMAAQALMSTLKSTQAPIHSAMRGKSASGGSAS